MEMTKFDVLKQKLFSLGIASVEEFERFVAEAQAHAVKFDRIVRNNGGNNEQQ